MGPYYVPAWGYVRSPLKHTLQQKSGLFIFWSPWHTCCGMEGLRVMESLMEALNSGEHFSTAVAWWRAVDYDVQLTTTWRLRRAPSANGSSRSLLWALQSPLPGHYNLVTSSLSSFTSTNIAPEPMSVLQFSRPPLPSSLEQCLFWNEFDFREDNKHSLEWI